MNLEELERLAREATPGPWHVRTIDGSIGTIDAFHKTVAQAQELSAADRNAGSVERRANAAYIAACSPETVLRLVLIAKAAEAVADDERPAELLGKDIAALRAAMTGGERDR